MQSKSIKKNWQQNLHKIYLPKIHYFIAELLIILEADLKQIQQNSLNTTCQPTMQALNSEKKTIIEMLSKSVDLIGRLNKFIYADKDELIEASMIEDDKKIIDAFIAKILDKNLYAE